jgi:hypothetical protein
MPNSSVTHNVDITFTLDEIMDLLRERADHISAVNRMVYDSATTNLEDDEPHFVLHYVAEAS